MTTSTAQSPEGLPTIGNLSSPTNPTSPTSSVGQVIHAEFSAARPLPIPNSVSLESLILEFESDAETAVELEQARRNLAYSLYTDESGTLTALRLVVGLSQARLADLVGTSQSHIAGIESGRTDPSTAMIVKLANALAVSEERAFKAVCLQRSRPEKLR